MIANDATRIPTESNGAAVVSDSPSANAETSRTTARSLRRNDPGNSRARWAESIDACTRDVKSRFSRGRRRWSRAPAPSGTSIVRRARPAIDGRAAPGPALRHRGPECRLMELPPPERRWPGRGWLHGGVVWRSCSARSASSSWPRDSDPKATRAHLRTTCRAQARITWQCCPPFQQPGHPSQDGTGIGERCCPSRAPTRARQRRRYHARVSRFCRRSAARAPCSPACRARRPPRSPASSKAHRAVPPGKAKVEHLIRRCGGSRSPAQIAVRCSWRAALVRRNVDERGDRCRGSRGPRRARACPSSHELADNAIRYRRFPRARRWSQSTMRKRGCRAPRA